MRIGLLLFCVGNSPVRTSTSVKCSNAHWKGVSSEGQDKLQRCMRREVRRAAASQIREKAVLLGGSGGRRPIRAR